MPTTLEGLRAALLALGITGPPHAHDTPGFWDGKPPQFACSQCKRWHLLRSRARKALAEATP